MDSWGRWTRNHIGKGGSGDGLHDRKHVNPNETSGDGLPKAVTPDKGRHEGKKY